MFGVRVRVKLYGVQMAPTIHLNVGSHIDLTDEPPEF